MTRKSLSYTFVVGLFTGCIVAQTTGSPAYGSVQLTVPGGTLAAVSATLGNELAHVSAGTANDDWTASPAEQTITLDDADWTTDQWISSGPHLAYVSDASGNEEAFLILGNTADTITIQAGFDLLDEDRDIPVPTSVAIREAHTFGSQFGTGEENAFEQDDKVYLWGGSGWVTYFADANGNWRKVGGGFGTFNDDVIFPDEGMFVDRQDSADLVLALFGAVPGKAQVSTIPAPGQFLLSMRYPGDTTMGELGIDDLPGWVAGSGGDDVNLWNGTSWVTYFTDANGDWRKVGGGFGTYNDDPVAAHTSVFVVRSGQATAEESANVHALPYAP